MPGFALTGGEALFGEGFAALACLDVSQGHPGVRKTATFHPGEVSLVKRYGGINIFDAIEYLPEQNAGAHAAGLNSQAPALLPLVFARMGITIAPAPQRDALDLSLLVGATQWVIQKAIEFKLLEPAAPPVDPPVVVPPKPPVLPPGQSGGLHPLSPASVRVEELRSLANSLPFLRDPRWLAVVGASLDPTSHWPAIKPFAVEALRFYRRLRAKLGDTREIPAEDR